MTGRSVCGRHQWKCRWRLAERWPSPVADCRVFCCATQGKLALPLAGLPLDAQLGLLAGHILLTGLEVEHVPSGKRPEGWVLVLEFLFRATVLHHLGHSLGHVNGARVTYWSCEHRLSRHHQSSSEYDKSMAPATVFSDFVVRRGDGTVILPL